VPKRDWLSGRRELDPKKFFDGLPCPHGRKNAVFCPHCHPTAPAATPGKCEYLAADLYEDGCFKATWRNFHENGHFHICVCGKAVQLHAEETASYTTQSSTQPAPRKSSPCERCARGYCCPCLCHRFERPAPAKKGRKK